mgnify:CR=1 FL=1
MYLSNSEVELLKESMSIEDKGDFDCGSGGELNEYKRKINQTESYNLLPPKMASFASSSLYAYNAFCEYSNNKKSFTTSLFTENVEDFNDITFEKRLTIRNKSNSRPHMDVFLRSKSSLVFIEVKCHEIYNKQQFILRKSYKQIVESIFLDNDDINIYDENNEFKQYLVTK